MTNRLLSLLFPIALLGCSSSPSGGAATIPAAPTDAGAPDDAFPPGDAASDAGDEAGAIIPTLPQAVSLGGPVVKSPKIVPVVWAGDPLSADIDAWLAAWDKTTYWADMLADYGIAKPALGATIRVAEAAPAALGDADIQTWVASRLDGTHPEFPTPDENTFFMLVYPPGTTITITGYGTSCQEFHGFHEATQIASGREVPYAVVSRCTSIPEAKVTGVQYVAAVASHEVIEGLADPFPFDHPAYADVDDAHRAWGLVTGGEIGDLCALQGNAFYVPGDFPYTVQKIWSNGAAKAGKDPCIPEKTGEPYFAAAPRLAETIEMPNGRGSGLAIPVGQERQVTVDVFADAPTSGPITLHAMEVRSRGHLATSLDRTTALPGETVTLTIKAVAASTDGAEPFAVTATVGGRTNYWFGAVAH
jgi:hypothetical protein